MARSTRGAPPPGIRYVFADDEPLRIKNAKSADAQAIGEELNQISLSNDGHLTPFEAVEAARDPGSPLHIHFEWDDRIAAESYRLDQARHIIRLIRVVDGEHDPAPRAFLSINEKAGVSYMPLSAVLNNGDLQAAVLRSAERDLAAFERRYRELSDVCSIIAEARERVAERRRRGLGGDQASA